jgi:hypothetical protein
LILDNHSAHISKETRTWLTNQPAGRFKFTFTPMHGSWLNVEGFFSKLARSILRHIRVSSKQELKDRLMAAVGQFNDDPVVTPGPITSTEPPYMIRISKSLN